MHAFTKLQAVRKIKTQKDLRAIHDCALRATENLKRSEAELICALQDVDHYLVHRSLGYQSLFQYALKALGLSEHQAYGFITVARKAAQLPAMQSAIVNGELTVSKLRKVTAVIDESSQEKWLELAKSSSRLEIEREVAKISPRLQIQEGVSFVAKDTLKLQAALSESTHQKLKRASELVAQKLGAAPSMEQVLIAALEEFIQRNDPVEKAKRVAEKNARRAAMKIESFQVPSAADKTSELSTGSRAAKEQLGPGRVQTETRDIVQSKVQDKVRGSANDKVQVKAQENAPNKAKVRKQIPAEILNAVYLRDQMKCQHMNQAGEVCESGQWIEVHHILPVAAGGADTLQNLTTLCKAHHQFMHH